MLERRPDLDFEANVVGAGDEPGGPADIMQRVVAETVQLVHLPLVDGVFAVNVEEVLHHGRDLVDVVAVKRNDTDPEQIRDIRNLAVFAALERQLAGQA